MFTLTKNKKIIQKSFVTENYQKLVIFYVEPVETDSHALVVAVQIVLVKVRLTI